MIDDSSNFFHSVDHLIKQSANSACKLLLIRVEAQIFIENNGCEKYCVVSSLLFHLLEQHDDGGQIGGNEGLNGDVVNKPDEVSKLQFVLVCELQEVVPFLSLFPHLVHWLLLDLLAESGLLVFRAVFDDGPVVDLLADDVHHADDFFDDSVVCVLRAGSLFFLAISELSEVEGPVLLADVSAESFLLLQIKHHLVYLHEVVREGGLRDEGVMDELVSCFAKNVVTNV
jgi:hypothetical protein